MQGAGSTDAWQFATPADLTIRLGILVALDANHWRHSAVVMGALLLFPYARFAAG